MPLRLLCTAALCLTPLAFRALGPHFTEGIARAHASQDVTAPAFQFDPTWPKPLPENWSIGPVVGVSVDTRDHVWIVHRLSALVQNERYTAAAANPPRAECCIPAPPVLEFDQAGNLVSAWGGAGEGYEWPESEHGIFVDHNDYVWLAGNGPTDAQILKFRRDGTFVQQLGRQGQSAGNADTQNLRRAADVRIDPTNNEVYVADGYGNRRVIVLDGETGGFKRMWGAYGGRPEDRDIGPYNPDAPPARQFRTVHSLAISNDGQVYVADRANDRVQVFTKDGTFVKEAFISQRTMLSGSASGVAFSADPEQRYLYVLDGANHRVWILLRDSLTLVGRFGQHGHWAGQLDVPHNIAVDSTGNLYIGETLEGRRVQRFLYAGTVPAVQ